MYGKLFASMYSGSLFGKGALAFAVWGYVIANAKPDRTVGGQVELNPALLAAVLGESKEEIEKVIEFFCQPDEQSRTEEKQGRRLIRLSRFDYQVVNFKKYHYIRSEEERREQNRAAQERYRIKKMKNGKPLPGETAYDTACSSDAPLEDVQKKEANGT